ncbi:MAG: 50S ribosomal protein L7ae [Clostridiaceae bacterium]|nr:50S ribosomal protein L7ae [Clostridiaceae bacterium]
MAVKNNKSQSVEIEITPNRVLSFIGLAAKAGRIIAGFDSVSISIGQKTAKLVIIARDTSPGTARKIESLCIKEHVPVYRFFDKNSLGDALGKSPKAIVAVMDENFAREIAVKMDRLIRNIPE